MKDVITTPLILLCQTVIGFMFSLTLSLTTVLSFIDLMHAATDYIISSETPASIVRIKLLKKYVYVLV